MFTEQQKNILCGDMLARFSPVQQDEFIAICERSGLDPFKKDIYGILQGDRMVTMVSISGLRSIAERSGEYAGQTPIEWCDHDGVWRDVWFGKNPPAAARVGILRKGFSEPLMSVATLDECGGTSPIWKKRCPTMLGKCAEANGLRRAFPNETAGLYVDGEVHEETPQVERNQPAANKSQEVLNAIAEQGHTMVTGADIEQPEPAPIGRPAGFINEQPGYFTEQEVDAWLMPAIETIGSTLEALRVAMSRARGIDKSLISLPPTEWPIDWKGRIDGWLKKNAKGDE